jgi:hypothetical protein
MCGNSCIPAWLKLSVSGHIPRTASAIPTVSLVYVIPCWKNTQTALDLKEDTYKNEYAERLGVDTYDAIAEMYANQFSYQAAMKVGSKIMQNSLFDFVQ